MTRKRWLGLIAIAGLLALLAPTLATLMARTAEPPFKVESSTGAIEIRSYPPILVAEVETAGDRTAAIGAGFRLLADYIFGNNVPNAKIAMTVPVTQQSGEKIAMTAPVTQQAAGSSWRIRFVMPQSFTIETLPKPNNPKVKIVTEPARRFVVIRFSGRTTDSNIAKYQGELDAYVTANALNVTGGPIAAFYNPPWTIPVFKRNEIMIALSR